MKSDLQFIEFRLGVNTQAYARVVFITVLTPGKMKLKYCGHLIRTADLLEKTLMLGKIEGRRRRG